jgi:hypothetical protein
MRTKIITIYSKQFKPSLPWIGCFLNDVLHQQQVLPSLWTARQHCQWRPVRKMSTVH